MSQPGLHRDYRRNYVAQNVQSCPKCYENFSSDRAANRHYKRSKPSGERCQDPKEVGLVAFKNKKGTTIWREKRNR